MSKQFPKTPQEWAREAEWLDRLIRKEAAKPQAIRKSKYMSRLWEERTTARLAAGYAPDADWPTDRKGNKIGQQLALG